MLVLLLAALLLLLPGYLAMTLAVPAEEWPGPMQQVMLAAGLSVAILPLVLLYTSVMGLSLTPAVFKGLLGMMGVGTVWRMRRLGWGPVRKWGERGEWPWIGLFLGLLGVTLGLRMVQIRGLVVPAWVDGVHHTLMTGLIAEAGGVPGDYGAWLGIGPFIYHYGFHALGAGLVWLSGLEVPRAVLVMGQVVNALVGVGVYGLTAELLGGRRGRVGGLVALGVVGTVSLMPGYYVTWGRYTQLAGLVVLPAGVVLTGKWVEEGKQWGWVLGGVAVAGLGLVHYRVLVFYVAFVVALLVYTVAGKSRLQALLEVRPGLLRSGANREVRGPMLRVAGLAGISLCLLSPWIARIVRVLVTRGAWPGLEIEMGYTAVPYDLLLMPRNVVLAVLAAWGLTLGVWRRQRGVILVGLWLLSLGILAALRSPLVPASAIVITFFLPAAMLIGYLVERALLTRGSRIWHQVAGVGLAGMALWSAAGMFYVINPTTVLLTPDDVAALGWVREHTPPDARFLINVRRWQGNVYVGTDAGYWISLLAGRETIPPPALYVLGTPEQVERINRVSRIAAGGLLDPDRLREAGITHVFIGARGGAINPTTLLSNPAFELLYMDGRDWVFRLNALAQVEQPARESAP